jgi:hypothetical protein
MGVAVEMAAEDFYYSGHGETLGNVRLNADQEVEHEYGTGLGSVTTA